MSLRGMPHEVVIPHPSLLLKFLDNVSRSWLLLQEAGCWQRSLFEQAKWISNLWVIKCACLTAYLFLLAKFAVPNVLIGIAHLIHYSCLRFPLQLCLALLNIIDFLHALFLILLEQLYIIVLLVLAQTRLVLFRSESCRSTLFLQLFLLLSVFYQIFLSSWFVYFFE